MIPARSCEGIFELYANLSFHDMISKDAINPFTYVDLYNVPVDYIFCAENGEESDRTRLVRWSRGEPENIHSLPSSWV